MGAAHKTKLIAASDLLHYHIGHLIRCRRFDAEREVATVTTGELRQIYMTQGEVVLNLGVGATEEVTLSPDDVLSLDPPDDYSDMTALIPACEGLTELIR